MSSITCRSYFKSSIRSASCSAQSSSAGLYHVTTGNLNKAVKRNAKRFPPDFMFQLNNEEFQKLKENLIFQNGISNWGGTRKLPYAFTEQGLAMLSGVFLESAPNHRIFASVSYI